MIRRPMILLCAVTAAGCASPPSRFYTLNSVVPPAPRALDLAVAVGPVAIPAEVDRPEILVTLGPNQVRPDEFNRWAAPLADNIAGVVAEDLTRLLGTPQVTLFPQTTSADADYRVAIEVQSFVSTLGEAAQLDAVWSVRRAADGRTETGRTRVRESVAGADYAALAAAHSRALARLSQDLADALSRVRSGRRSVE